MNTAGTRKPKHTGGKNEPLLFNPININPFPEFKQIGFRGDYIYFKLDDGRKITIPLHAFPILEKAKPEQRKKFHTNGVHIFWDELDEIIGIKNILGPGATKY